jgi:hypothetical protein
LWWIPIVRRFFIFFFLIGDSEPSSIFFYYYYLFESEQYTASSASVSSCYSKNTHTHAHTHYTIGPALDARLYSLCYYYVYTLPGTRVSFCFFGLVEILLLATTIIIMYLASIIYLYDCISITRCTHHVYLSARIV